MKFRFLVGIFFVSSATLCLEISLIRFFSISQQYHFAFLVVSIAFLGYGASGSCLSLVRNLQEKSQENFFAWIALLFSVSIPLSAVTANAIPFDLIELSWDSSQIFLIFLYYIVLSLPFFFAGIIISFAITRNPASVNIIYFFDLLGAGSGTLLTIFIFLPRGDIGVTLILSSLVLLAAWFFGIKMSVWYKASIFLLLVVEIFLFVVGPSWLSFRISSFKALPVAMKYPGAEHLFTRWNAISRIDVIDSPAVRFAPGLSLLYTESLPRQLGLSTDGGDLNAITHYEALEDPHLDFLTSLPSSFPYSILDRPQVFILEPKGGLDLLAALYFDASYIKVIEDNPLIGEIAQGELSSFSGQIYENGKTHLETSNSRSALKKEKNHYDLIVFSLGDVFGSTGTGQYGFGEKYLYTIESFSNTLDRLSSGGIASMTFYLLPPPRQEIRILATWIEALRRVTDEPEAHLIAIRSWATISYFIKKTPFGSEDIKTLKDFAERNLYDLVYYPGIKPGEPNRHNQFDNPLYYDIAQRLLSPSEYQVFYKDYLFDVKPVSDDKPFFYNFFKLNKIKITYAALGQKLLPLLQGEFLVFIILAQAAAVAFSLILLPVIIQHKRRIRRKTNSIAIFIYFGLIGMSFIFLEITFIQKFILFLGDPLYSMALIIFVLLFSSGIGSLLSKNILGKNVLKNVKTAFVLSALLIVSYTFILPRLFDALIGLNLIAKFFLSLSIIFPLGFLMGFPFPTGIRLLENAGKKVIPWAWATNAFSSVVNSVAALVIAFWGGYTLVMIIAAGGYLIAPFFLGFSDHGNKSDA
jgi:hypothetical protein